MENYKHGQKGKKEVCYFLGTHGNIFKT